MKLKKYIIGYLFFLSFASCKKSFLEVPDGRVIYRQEYVKDLTTLQEFLNGAYLNFRANVYYAFHMIYPELIADNVKPVSTPPPALGLHYSWKQQADGENSSVNNFNNFSYLLYNYIRAGNFVIEKAQEYRDQNPSKADIMIGETYAMRALTHFWLVNVYAQAYNFTVDASHPGIAYVTSSDYTQPVVRLSVAEVYNHMISDLNKAVELLPAISSNQVLNLTPKGIKALLARIYLFKEDYTAAKNFAREVSSLVPIMTNTPTNRRYPDSLYRQGDTEAILYMAPGKPNHIYSGALFSSSYVLYFLSTSDMAGILKERATDKRSVWVTQTSGTWRITKFPSNVVPGLTAPTSYYQPIVRSSEMYLTAAEAYAKLSNEDSARYYLNAIRMRADETTLPLTTTGPALLDSIYKERRKELCFESLRMFDLLRWKKGVNRIDAPDPTAQNLPYPSNKAIAPIPVTDVNISGIPQNLDY